LPIFFSLLVVLLSFNTVQRVILLTKLIEPDHTQQYLYEGIAGFVCTLIIV